MLSAKEKISNMASAAKKHVTICRAKVDEKVERASARTHEQKQIAKERRKAKEAQAKMKLHQEKAKHAAEKLSGRRAHHLSGATHTNHHYPTTVDPVVGTHAHQPVGTTGTMAGTTVPTYPLGGHPPGYKYV
ncbi:hypothetical protein JCGZ_19500 [Jatropha curcas]|uniref:Uncharacterized protein n=1 Tax=Jatropha curcas TaxID=180498 RepID=A0A067JYG5_JATCU|nr:late embryogenesis abundant protein 6 [Jatropha curcas]KDP29011.1 hypothetical protein JCGZ_19500 [Jatropha curcas]